MKTESDLLIITHAKAFGGAERHTVNLLSRLAELDIQFTFLYSGNGLDSKFTSITPHHYIHKIDVDMNNFKAREFIKLRSLLRTYKSKKVFIIKPSYFTFPAAFILLARLYGTSLAVIEHSLPVKRPDLDYIGFIPKVGLWRIKDEINRLCHSMTPDKVISVSEIGKSQLVEHTYLKAKDIYVCENGIRFEDWKYNENEANNFCLKYGINRPTHIFGCVGHLFPIKAFEIAVEAMSLLSPAYRNMCYLCIVGGGPEHKRLRALIDKFDLTNILLIEQQSQMVPVYSAIDTLLITSKSESAPLALLEAIACGCEVIASDTGNCKKIIETFRVGTVVKSRSPASWKVAMTNSLKNTLVGQRKNKKFICDVIQKQYELDTTLDKIISVVLR